jgi:peptidoglycan/LPS O-acetylase OafA/YrhL
VERKIAFADHLRGIAAFVVVVAHLVILYWKEPDVVTSVAAVPALKVATPVVVEWLATVDIGAFGVALFFLISGFVIPLSCRHHTPMTFLMARALRIWPTYLAALACVVAIRSAAAWWWGAAFQFSSRELVANALLVQDFVNAGSLDLVNWSLSLEVQFYLLFAVGYSIVLKYRERVVVYAACVLPLLLTLQFVPGLRLHFGLTAARPGMCLPFMLIGTLFYLRMEGLITLRAMLSAALFTLLSVAFCFTMLITPTMALSYIAAFAVFLALFLVRERIGQNRLLAWLSAVSYPLYLVHSAIGYVVLRLVTVGLGFSYPAALAAAVTAALLVAILLHVAVEGPSMAIGKRLTTRWTRSKSGQGVFASVTGSDSGPAAYAGFSDATPAVTTRLI